MDYSQERKTRWEIGFDSVNGEPLQVRWNWKIRTILNVFIPSSMEFSQTLSRIPAGGDFLPENQISADCRYIETILLRRKVVISSKSEPDFKEVRIQIACQITNYQFFIKYCRYFLNTCTLSNLEIKCQIEIKKMGFWVAKFENSDSQIYPFLLGYNL
jgi:hypothetical protein